MCGAVRLVVDGEMRSVSCGVQGAELPVLMRSGGVSWFEWGASKEIHLSSPEAPGHLLRFPRGQWIERSALRDGTLWQTRPRPVKISVQAFSVDVAVGQVWLSRWIELKRGQYLQGALMKVFAEQRVYVVTEPPPDEYAGIQPCWPRILQA